MISDADKQLFQETFGVPITHFKGTLNILLPIEETGIDIVKFCHWLEPNFDNINKSGAQLVKDRYGDDARMLIERVI